MWFLVKRSHVSTCIIFVMAAGLSGCSNDFRLGKNDHAYSPVCISNKWGYVDNSGRLAISPCYLSASEFHGGLAAVKVDTCVTVPVFSFVTHIEDDGSKTLKFTQTGTCEIITQLWGYIDGKAKFVILPRYESAGSFTSEYAYVKLCNIPEQPIPEDDASDEVSTAVTNDGVYIDKTGMPINAK